MPTKLKTVLENLDDVPDALKDSYVEKDGKFILELEGIDDHPNVVALKNALERQKSDRRKVAEELTKMKERLAKIPEDFDPDKYAEILAKLEEYEADPAKKAPVDDAKAQEAVRARTLLEQKIASMEKAHKTAVDGYTAQIRKRDEYISQLLIDDGLTKALVEVGVDKNLLKAAKAYLAKDVKVVEEDGKYVAQVETDTGTLEIDRYVADWAASDEGKAFVPPPKGGGAGGDGVGKKPPARIPGAPEKNPWAKEHFNMTEQGRIMKADYPLAEKLAKAAGAKLAPRQSV